MAKKKILLLSDDLRMNSGIATMSRELVISTVHQYDWVQLAGAINHPEKGKAFDLSQSTNEMKKMKDAYVKLYPVDGYGNEQTLFQVISIEKPDAILHFTDPRFWGWLYALERPIRGSIPLTYLNIWDDIPYPMYNRPFYESCDALFSISRQTMNINKWVVGPESCCTINGEFDKDGNIKLSEDLIQFYTHYFIWRRLNKTVRDKNTNETIKFTEEFMSNNISIMLEDIEPQMGKLLFTFTNEQKERIIQQYQEYPVTVELNDWIEQLKRKEDKSKSLSKEIWTKERDLEEVKEIISSRDTQFGKVESAPDPKNSSSPQNFGLFQINKDKFEKLEFPDPASLERSYPK